MKRIIQSSLAVVALCTVLAPLAKSYAPSAPSSFSIFSLPQNLGPTVNTVDSESGAFVAPNGLSLYVTSTAAGTLGSHDLWVAQRPTLTAAWGPLQNLGPTINTGDIENHPSLSLDGKTMLFNSTRPGFGASDLYLTTRTDPTNDFGWTAPVNLGAVINTTADEIAPAYFENQSNGSVTLYFTSNRLNGVGSEDLYQSTRNANGTFNAPTNVAALNSTAVDRGFAITRDGLEVLFTSDRIGSVDRDIWYSTRASVDAPWNPPSNLAGVNSPFVDQMPSLSADGSTLYIASSRDNGLDVYAATRVSVNRSPIADFDGDGRTDYSVFRPSDGTWYAIHSSNNTFHATQFGLNGDRVVAGDYDGDGRTDFGVFRPSDQNWYVLRSSDGSFTSFKWGLSTDKPVPGDYDGDGRTDIAVYRNGSWYVVQSSNGSLNIQQFGLSGDIPISSGVQ